MAAFPSPLEQTVASALLLLSTKPTYLSPSKLDIYRELSMIEASEKKFSNNFSLVFSSESKSCSSSLTSDASSQEIPAHKLKSISVSSRCQDMKLQIVRKSHSKLQMKHSFALESTEATSLSNSSSSRRRNVIRADKRHHVGDEVKKRGGGSAQISRRAEAILNLLSATCSSEVNIRGMLGDSPDTSKALRMLLKQEEIKRHGTGGRQDPYVYTIA